MANITVSKRILWQLAAFLLASTGSAQQLPQSSQKAIDEARSHYYSISSAGFMSMSCSIKFDWTTVPNVPLPNAVESRTLLQNGTLTLTIDQKGRSSVEQHFSDGSSEQQIRDALPLTSLLKSLVGGVFQTWPTKGLQGPIPSFNSEIETVSSFADGFDFSLHVAGSPVHILMDKDYRVTKISSIGGKIIEFPSYEPSPDGLVFVGNHALDQTQTEVPVDVSYQLGIAIINGLRVPSSVHLRVNDNLDVRYNLEKCTVQKGQVLKVAPPPH